MKNEEVEVVFQNWEEVCFGSYNKRKFQSIHLNESEVNDFSEELDHTYYRGSSTLILPDGQPYKHGISAKTFAKLKESKNGIIFSALDY